MIKNILVAIDGSEHARSATEHALWIAGRAERQRDRAARRRHRLDRGLVPPRHLRLARVRAVPRLLVEDARGARGARPRHARRVLRTRRRGRRALRHADGRGRHRQRDLRAGADGRPRRHRPSRRQREVLDRPARRHRRERDAQVPEAGARLPDGMEGRHSKAAARLRRQPTLGAAQCRRPPTSACRFACRSPWLTWRATRRRGRASSTRPSATSRRTRSRPRSPPCRGTPRSGSSPRSAARAHDLLFIGAYGHSRIVEMVLGSTTEYVLRNAPCPVFLSR